MTRSAKRRFVTLLTVARLPLVLLFFVAAILHTMPRFQSVAPGLFVLSFASLILSAVTDLCTLADAQWAYAVDLAEYAAITAENCGTFSGAGEFLRFSGTRAVVDAEGLAGIIGLAWVDVINAAVWLLVVLVLEVDVRLQEHNRYEGAAFRASAAIKAVLYATLLLAAIYWGINGDFVDFWDAFLWLVAFVFIELNVFEWRAETRAELAEPG